MKNFYQVILVFIVSINTASSNQCTFNSSENQLVKRTVDLLDSSPFFKKHEFNSYKKGTWDIDSEDFYINPYGYNKLQLTGNSWKAVKLKSWFVVKPNSYLQFQFLSNGDEAEVNGVGLVLKNATGFHGTRFFQVYGVQNVAGYNQDYHNYSGNKWVTYRIPLWQYFQNTSNKIVEQLVFAADDDEPQVNQSVYYKNIELIEDYSEYQLPVNFQHDPVIIEPTANKNYFHHVYPQTITGPDSIDYPVSGGSIVKRVYAPPNSNIEDVISIKENYYESLCWDQGMNYSANTLANDSMNYLQLIANNSINGMDTFRNQQPVILTQLNQMYFDPDVKVNGQIKSRFINRAAIYSNRTPIYYFESKEAGQNNSIKSGLIFNGVDCNQPATGKNTKNQCFDLTGLTSFNNSTGLYDSDSDLTTVHQDMNISTANYDENDFDIVTDTDDKWSESTVKQQTTEVLINTKYFNEYIKSYGGSSGIETYTGYKPEAIIDSPITTNAGFSSATRKVYFSPPGQDYFGKSTTFSRDLGVVAHEYTHAISSHWFGGQLVEGSVEGCAINEGFSDILGYGAKVFTTGVYDPRAAIDAYDNNDAPNGIRSAQNPLLTGNHSVFIGNAAQTVSCVPPVGPELCPISRPDWCSNSDWEHVSGHQMGTIVSHLYHLMVYGGFNADPTFRPDPFGVSQDEIFTHKVAETFFFNAMAFGHGSANATGSDVTFCELRNNMIDSTTNDTDKVKLNQAWKQVYQDLDSDDTDDGDGKKCQLPGTVELLKPEISITNITNNNTAVWDGGGIQFGTLDVGYSRTFRLEIKNEGDYILRLINPQVDSAFSQVGLSNQQLTIEVGSSKTIDVRFHASSNNYGQNNGTLTFQTNHPDHETFTINLIGTSNELLLADEYENDDTIEHAKYLATIIDYEYIPYPFPPGYDCNSVPWVGSNPPSCSSTYPVPIADRNFTGDNVDWIIAKLYYRGEMGPFEPFVLQISNFQNFPVDICYESEDLSALAHACVNISANSTHSVNFTSNIWAPPEGLEYKIKLTNPTPAINYEYLAIIR